MLSNHADGTKLSTDITSWMIGIMWQDHFVFRALEDYTWVENCNLQSHKGVFARQKSITYMDITLSIMLPNHVAVHEQKQQKAINYIRQHLRNRVYR